MSERSTSPAKTGNGAARRMRLPPTAVDRKPAKSAKKPPSKSAKSAEPRKRVRASATEDIVSTRSTKTVSTCVIKDSQKGEPEEWEEIEVEQFQAEPAHVKVSAGVTKSLGEYEFLRVDVSVNMPCYRELVHETYQATSDIVAELLENEILWYMESNKSD